jgi:transposase
MPTSPDTLLRRVKHAPDEPGPPPRCVGIDDWAVRKGRRYGTILVDLERRRIIDLLPQRDGAALKTWLQAHPGIEVITRDRSAAFAQAVTEAAPQAKQVADRWHLLKNLRETIEGLLKRLSGIVAEAFRDASATETGRPPEPGPSPASRLPEVPPTDPPVSADSCRRPLALRKQAQQARQQQRVERFERVRALRTQGYSLRQIARAVGLSTRHVIRYLRIDHCPDWNPGRRLALLQAFGPQIDAWMAQGRSNASELHRELSAQGCQASYFVVRDYLIRRRRPPGATKLGVDRPPLPRAVAVPSARHLSFAVLRRVAERSEEEQQQIDRLQAINGVLREGVTLAESFAALVRQTAPGSLADWLEAAQQSGCAELRAFAATICQDESAVAAAMTEPWSNGPVEGHVNRLKLVKRSMYGRAGWQLLRARVRQVA